MAEWNLTHGESKTPLYAVWASMKRRCLSPSQQSYALYGGRGITVCDQWKNSYESFREWALTSGYEKGLFLDRENNNLGYSPENCRWIGQAESNRNRRSILISPELAVTIKQLYHLGFCQKDMAYVYGIDFRTINRCIHHREVPQT